MTNVYLDRIESFNGKYSYRTQTDGINIFNVLFTGHEMRPSSDETMS